MNFGQDIEHGGYPTSETRSLPERRADADRYAGIGVRKRSKVILQKGVDSSRTLDVVSSQAPITAPETANKTPISASLTRRRTVTLTLKGHSKNGKTAFYTGAATVIRISLGAFINKQAPTIIEVEPDFAPVKAPRVKLTAEERAARNAAAKAARAAAPKPTLAEKIARREALLARDKAKLAEATL